MGGRSNNRGVHYRFDVEIDLHGLTVDEAIYKLEEDIFVNANSAILVIHGNGNGILRRTVRSFAASNKYVKSFSGGEELNLIGGFGVTVLYTV